jgi:hypothetical protein
MTALARNNHAVQQKDHGLDLKMYLVTDNVHIYKGAIVAVDATNGLAHPAANAANDVIVGIAQEEFDNTIPGHAAGGRDALGRRGVKVMSGAHFLLLAAGTATQAAVGDTWFVLDDQTVQAADPGNSNTIGRVVEFVDATHVWIDVKQP